jgi:hypothetical protein
MKKTNKVHPLTAFRKANETRQAVVKKSLKKAQDGIATVAAGPLTEKQSKNLDKDYPSTTTAIPRDPWYNTSTYNKIKANAVGDAVGRETQERKEKENFLRNPSNFNKKKGGQLKNNKTKYPDGGGVKKSSTKPKTYNQQLIEKYPKNITPNDTLPENSLAGVQFFAAQPYKLAKRMVDEENKFNDEYGESRVRSKSELDTMKKKLSSYQKKGGSVKKMKKGGTIKRKK